ncbi:MAG: hypothetical protein LBG26_02995 [Treponema sp.]|jgi:chromosome segregation ATPase|nr:hypothetical protein [Treponema sp.]
MRENRVLFFILVAGLLLCSVAGALRAQEPDQWYLISETELRSIEQYKANSEREKLNWLSQLRELQTAAANSAVRSAKLEADSASLNRQLAWEQAERQSWQTRARQLKQQAGNSETRANRLALESERLSAQLAQAGETNRKLEQSFNEYEAGRLALISSKNGEIAGLKQEVAHKTLEAEKYKGDAAARLFIIIGFAASWVIFIAVKVFFRSTPIKI